ncbi:MAG: hypothetical protein MZV64_54695 [Ignavibacteriales bacterium]|nr:hypothetical protein [Ignavibacteriales bacterium]
MKAYINFFKDVFSFNEDEAETNDKKAADDSDSKENLDKIKKLSSDKRRKRKTNLKKNYLLLN